jgi:hypothetical protein
MSAYAVTLLSIFGLCASLVFWLVWTGRRDFRIYRAWSGGRWGCVRDSVHWGMAPVLRWMPEGEIQEGHHVVEWETWPKRTRVRWRKK